MEILSQMFKSHHYSPKSSRSNISKALIVEGLLYPQNSLDAEDAVSSFTTNSQEFSPPFNTQKPGPTCKTPSGFPPENPRTRVVHHFLSRFGLFRRVDLQVLEEPQRGGKLGGYREHSWSDNATKIRNNPYVRLYRSLHKNGVCSNDEKFTYLLSGPLCVAHERQMLKDE